MSSVKVRIKDIFTLEEGLKAINNSGDVLKDACFKFKYAIGKNTKLIDNAIKDIKDMAKWKPDYISYAKERAEIRKSLAVKENGQPIVVNNDYVVEDEEAFDETMKPVKEKYKEAIDEQEARAKKLEESMFEEIEVELHTIPQVNVPEAITPGQLSGIISLIDEEVTG
jgi:myosin heavy subunit